MRVDNSSFLEATKKNSTVEAKGSVSVSTNHTTIKKTNQSAGLTVSVKQSTYEKPRGTTTVAEEIAASAGDEQSAKARHNEMAVLSNTMSSEDYEEFQKNGYQTQDMDSHTIVTVVDKIKMELAQSGVDISDMGGSIDKDMIEKYAGSATLANQISKSLEEADLPVTQDNMSEEQQAYELAMSLTDLSDGAVKYMVDNELEPDISSFYRAQNGARAGYGSACISKEDAKELEEQVKEVIEQAGLEVNEDTVKNSNWMIANEIPLTAENLTYVTALKELKLPLEQEQVIDAMTTAIAEGARPENAYLMKIGRAHV